MKDFINHFIFREELDNFKKKNTTILVSSFFYLLPALYIIYSPLKKFQLLVFVSFLQIILSILSDYVYIESKDKYALFISSIDRINSIIYTFILVYYLILSNTIFALVCVLLTIILIEYSRKSKTQTEWVERHTIWHVCSSIILLLCLNHVKNNLNT